MISQQEFGAAQASDEVRLSSASAYAPSANTRAAYFERVDEYEDRGFLQADPDAALSAAILAPLIRAAFVVEARAHEALAHCPSTNECIRVAIPLITRYLRALRQIEQNVSLELGPKKNSSPRFQ